MEIDDLDELRVIVREERMRQGIRQSDFPGLSRKTVNAFENGASAVEGQTLFAMLRRLDLRMTVTPGSPGATPARTMDDDEQLIADDDIDLGGLRP
jgi:transcriptional regulator with XRE-family HTH domain